MLAALLYARRRKSERRRRLCLLRRNARRRRIEAFEQKQYLESVPFVVFLWLTSVVSHLKVERQVWMKERSSDWWERIVLAGFTENDWLENFRMGKVTFTYICNQLCPRIKRKSCNEGANICGEKS